MFRFKLRAHPQSILTVICNGQWSIPLLNLFWLVYLGIGVLYVPMSPWARGFTGLSLLLFLPLYAAAWLDDRARLLRYTALIALLGFITFELSSVYSYLIYAASFLSYIGSRRTGWIYLSLMLLAFVVLAALSPFFNAISIGFGAGVCILVALFNHGFRNKAERDAALRLSHEELRRMAASAERERIGRDLHDTLGATLALIAVKSELAGRLLGHNAEAARNEVADIQRVAREALAQVRQAVSGIRSAVLVGEVASARVLLESSGVAFVADLDALPLAAPTESALAMSLREAATNVQRHAHAQAVRVTLRRDGGEAVLSVEDDGRGADIKPGNGLRGMRERLEAVGGRLQIDSSTGGTSRGTRLAMTVALA